ncbi:MAG TPA: protein kinase [Myxococcota bacterium]
MKILRAVALVAALALTAAGSLGLAMAYFPDHDGVESARGAAERGLDTVIGLLPEKSGGKARSGEELLAELSGSLLRFVLAPLGLVILGALLLPGGNRAEEEGDEEGGRAGLAQVEQRHVKRAKRQAVGIARKGMPLEAAELCFAVGLMDEAAKYFVKAEEYVRAAEIRHDQNRFMESAELYARAGQHDAAGVIYSQHGEFGRAAEAYAAAEDLSVAAEMFEKAGNHLRAAECYEKCEFPRHAAQAYTRCERWEKAAACMEQVLVDEAPIGAGGDAQRDAEYGKLIRMTGHLWERAGRLDKAEAVFEKGGLFSFAADIAQKGGNAERAAQLYLRAKDVQRAAAAMQRLGKAEEAARILAEHYRDKGQQLEAAEQFEQAGEMLEAGDLYRVLERYDLAGECYERYGDGAQAAEMFRQAGDRRRAAQNYERAGQFAEAAACYAEGGDNARQAAMLERAGECFRAGQIHLENGREEEAIGALQKVGPDDPHFSAAAAALGKIFRDREMYPVALAKLQEAVGQRELDRDNVAAFYCLATVHEANGELEDADRLYQKIMAFDYHYEDVEERLAHTRKRLEEQSRASEEVRPGASGAGQSGRYIIRGTLGRGGMGIVYKAEDTVLDRLVAFKVLPEALKENPQALKNFLREAKSAAQLNHPNIVTIYDAGEQDGVFYIAMEYVDGKTLKEIIKRKGAISPRAAAHVLAQMAEALAYAHEKKIVHRDIKTANTMWTKDRKAKIMDFGLAKVIEEVRNHTTVVSGTPYYMSPEQTLGKNVDHRTDIYSLGVSAFEMATGTLPFTEGNLPYHHLHTPPPSPREFNADLPDFLVRIIERCLSKDPGERYQSSREILEELKSEL